MLDAYTRRARLAPAALAAAPALFLAGGALLAIEDEGAIIAFVLGAASIVLCGLVRNRGRSIEADLWQEWGGAPTTQLLRWSGPTPQLEQARRHSLLAELLGEPLPTAVEEQADPAGADVRYGMATTALRQHTRDGGRYHLVSTENAEYGFRRNCLGLRPIAIPVALFSFIISVVLICVNGASGRYVGPAVISVVCLLLWLLVIRARWVRSAGEIYARRLMESIESLSTASGA